MVEIVFKRGDTFQINVAAVTRSGGVDTPVNLTGTTITSQIRNSSGQLIQNLTLSYTDPGLAAGLFTLTALPGSTISWDLGKVYCDIRYESSASMVNRTETFVINVLKEVTA